MTRWRSVSAKDTSRSTRRDGGGVDDGVADEPGQADVHQPRVSDLDLAQVTVPEARAGEVSAGEAGSCEAGTAKCTGAVVVSCHRAIVPNRPQAHNRRCPEPGSISGRCACVRPGDRSGVAWRPGGPEWRWPG